MTRYEVTGGNGRGASLPEIQSALRKAGAYNVRARNAYGWSNQPQVATFSAKSDNDADKVCNAACEILWPHDPSIMASLIAFRYGASQ
jgi:peptidoglycan hydrolase-like protein with peptidoglycan-binding domain